MNLSFDAYNMLPDEEKKKYQSHRTCDCGAPLVGINGHSTGSLHVMCPVCRTCPDCDEGE